MACSMLDMQALPSLEKFDSQLLDRLLRASTGDAQLPLMDEACAPDSEEALQRLMADCSNSMQPSEAQPQVRDGRTHVMLEDPDDPLGSCQTAGPACMRKGPVRRGWIDARQAAR